MKKIIVSLFTIFALVAVVASGTQAVFVDTETVSGNTIAAGTLNLTVDDAESPVIANVDLSGMVPGETYSQTWILKNTGSLEGQPSVEFSAITEDDNGCVSPETDAGDVTCGPGEGELGQELLMQLYADNSSVSSNMVSIQGEHYLSSSWGGEVWLAPGNPNSPSGVWNTIGEDETVQMRLNFRLDEDAGNIIQSDSTSFDIIFHLDQV